MNGVQGLLPVSSEVESDLRVYRLTLPFLPPSKNVYDGWLPMWKSSAKKKWVRHIVEQCAALEIPAAERIGLAAVLVFPTRSRRDPQNYSNCLWHWVPDALQTAGVIEDDREGMIEIGKNWGLRFQVDDRKGVSKEARSRTHLAITMKVKNSEG